MASRKVNFSPAEVGHIEHLVRLIHYWDYSFEGLVPDDVLDEALVVGEILGIDLEEIDGDSEEE